MNHQLAVNTSQSDAQIALFADQKLVGERRWSRERSHSEVLTNAFQELLQEHATSIDSIDKIYCVNGPGSFTGIRVGVNFCKTLAFALNCPVVAINALDLQMAALEVEHSHVLSTIDAQKNSIFFSLYKTEQAKSSLLLENQVIPIAELQRLLKKETLVVGAGLQKYLEFLEPAVRESLTFADHSQDLKNIFDSRYPKALDEQKWSEVVPVYIKASAAEEKRNPTQF